MTHPFIFECALVTIGVINKVPWRR